MPRDSESVVQRRKHPMFSVALTVYSRGVTRVGQCKGIAFGARKKEQRANTKKVFCPLLSLL